MVEEMSEKLSVLLVDDHNLVRRGFRRIIEDEPDMAVVGESGNGVEAVELARKLNPQVVVMDCALPQMSGLVAARQILRESPSIAVLMLSMHSEETWVRQDMDAGARGYLLKSAMDLELPAAVRKVAAGETVLDPALSSPTALKGEHNAALTPRELEVLQLIVEGKSNRQIADQLRRGIHEPDDQSQSENQHPDFARLAGHFGVQ